jgi:hypothetical protein
MKIVVRNIHDNRYVMSFLLSLQKRRKWSIVFFHGIVEELLNSF